MFIRVPPTGNGPGQVIGVAIFNQVSSAVTLTDPPLANGKVTPQQIFVQGKACTALTSPWASLRRLVL